MPIEEKIPVVQSATTLRSKQLGVRHGFSTRLGGVSEGPFASLNLGPNVGDEPERVEQNGRIFARAQGLSPGQLVSVRQVHGTHFLEVGAASCADRVPAPVGEADGLYTRERGVALCIRTADCVPLLLWAPDQGAIAAVHAGWRGALAAIARRAVEHLSEHYGAAPHSIKAAIGPSIRSCCYEVKNDLAMEFERRFGEGVASRALEGSPRLDIAEANRRALLEAGVLPEGIDVVQSCTACDSARFFSHRRDRGRTGRHLSFLVL
jgi:YfiH family protein